MPPPDPTEAWIITDGGSSWRSSLPAALVIVSGGHDRVHLSSRSCHATDDSRRRKTFPYAFLGSDATYLIAMGRA